MWWETVIVGVAVSGSLLWLGRTLLRSRKRACDGCGPRRPASRLQTEIPVLEIDRRA